MKTEPEKSLSSLPPVTHVYVGNTLKRLDQITLEEAKLVIQRLVDELDYSRSVSRNRVDRKRTPRPQS
jgi:hypothetical protein